MGRPRGLIDVLTPEEVVKMHQEAMRVLERVGMSVPHDLVRKACEKAGFKVSNETVRFPQALVEELIAAHRPKKALEDPSPTISAGISTQVFIVDYPGKERRKGRLSDVRRGARVSDTLSRIRDSSAVVVPADVPADRTDIASCRELYLYSTRPGATYILSPETGRGIIEMGRVVGRDNGYLLETVSPLGYMHSSLETARIFAEAGMPISTAPMVISGASGPMSIWGNCVLQIAEITGTNLIIYAMSGKFKNYMTFSNHTMDMRTTLCSFGSPNQALFGMVAGQMGRYYGWGGSANISLSDACVPDYQSGLEKGLTGLAGAFAGCTGFGAQGIVGADQGMSLEQLVLDNEWLSAYEHVLKGVPYDPEAVDLIEEIGILGNYMAEEHTVAHLREVQWTDQSRSFWRDQWQAWSDQGASDSYERAHRYVLEHSQGYEDMDPVLDSARAAEIDRIYQETLKRLDG